VATDLRGSRKDKSCKLNVFQVFLLRVVPLVALVLRLVLQCRDGMNLFVMTSGAKKRFALSRDVVRAV
jgi:hypothetical protein